MSEYSQKRIEARLSEAISTLIVTGEIKSPMVSTLCSVSRVQLSVDNAFATVYISSVLDDDSLQASVEALQKASGFIQKRVGAFLKTRNTPVLTFKADVSLKEGQKINALIDTLVEDGNKR
ncbi:MAG: 30S ribosome-binding factor RbfA [Sphaerochaeta sp.]|jgi:ribosome-binding factor A|uniref:30S ribosome-binding factor RbfA n=1 Tax=unclassified Sphaerochaeta TaxID=2637943 RepID=UPI000A7022BE|nr:MULTISPECIES: 30S ribosome-binding factor RbfA [unclassified Sphaerochaeta]MCK9599187.1 30S ribosome-binding factor RbfA [Sphaerochaeta sp.]MDX9824404.1 30S ribosome-binding factor RbfA [Sphaerochaeta sp.]MEA4864108.1 30S ribosome-binding factor RbfA [Sphaerochaeta sp.]HAP57762.1 30S ribosome-binding factor RbfA [Sphaerochaeta sp.]HBO35766.1 30S ribosome-binding factor RbfA [Sphaerochaeta sp.]